MHTENDSSNPSSQTLDEHKDRSDASLMHYILFYDVVQDYVARRTQYRTLHLEHVRRAYERGELVLAGALAEPVDGAVLVFRGSSPEVAEEFAKTDPYVVGGLVTTWRVRKWMTVVGEGATPP